MTSTVPRFPILIPSRGRAETALTPDALDRLGVPYRLVVEEAEREAYEARWPGRILTLDPVFQRDYDTFDDLGDSKPRGPGPARNFIWETSIREGADWHWVMDDNISLFARLHRNERVPVGDGTIFHAMETFALRYRNVAMVGPNYWMFAASRSPMPPFVTGTRIYSCNLIRNSIPYRWRGRYNEDTDLSLRALKDGWATVQFNAFLQYKMPTQTVKGGNTEAFYEVEGTLAKSRMQVAMHPDVSRLVRRYGRWHHHVDYSRFLGMSLIRDDEAPPEEPNYQLRRVTRTKGATI